MSQINSCDDSNKNGLCNDPPGLGVPPERTSSEIVKRLGIFLGVSTSNSHTVWFCSRGDSGRLRERRKWCAGHWRGAGRVGPGHRRPEQGICCLCRGVRETALRQTLPSTTYARHL